ncbi:MAG: type III pantothenate kinase [bacterium]
MTTSYFLDIGNSYTDVADPNTLAPLKQLKTETVIKNPEILGCQKKDLLHVSSVVPQASQALKKYYHNVHILNYQHIPFTNIDLPQPQEIGIDRLLSAYAAWKHAKKTVVIIDAGTALTFCVVNNAGVYLGGMILPGVDISSKALNDYTAKIPYIQVKVQETLIGKSTKEAVAAGLYHGYKTAINGLIGQYRAQFKDSTVYGTGNSLRLFNDNLDIDCFDERLLFKGMKETVFITRAQR